MVKASKTTKKTKNIKTKEKKTNGPSLKVYNLDGIEVGQKSLSSAVFSKKAKPQVIAQAVDQKQANRRGVIANTKIRGEVSGGGRKPFKQKGTGNARAGSTRSPLWIGGGVTFGPRKQRNFKKRMPKMMNRLALQAVLSQKYQDGKIVILNDFKLPKVSTRQVYEIFSHLPFEEGKILVILENLEFTTELSLANIPYAKVVKSDNLNILDLLKYDYILTTVGAIEKIEAFFGKNNETAVK